jgi:hypothetical protein
MLMTTAPRPSRAEAASAPKRALVNRNGPNRFTISACSKSSIRVGERHEGGRAEGRCVVDERIEPAKIASDLQCDRIDVVRAPDIADNSTRPRLIGDPLDHTGGASDKGNVSAAGDKQPDESPSEAGRSTRDGHAQSSQVQIS